jgi:hypothetical protein
MNKKQVQQRISRKGKRLHLKDFTWDEKTKTFSSEKDYLVIDFRGIDGCIFNIGSYCTADVGSYNKINSGSDCTFDTEFGCTFNTGDQCVAVRRGSTLRVIKSSKGGIYKKLN